MASVESENQLALLQKKIAQLEAELVDLREIKQRYLAMTDNAPFSVIIHSAGIIRYANKAGVDAIGASCQEELLGKQVLPFIHPDSREVALKQIALMYGEQRSGGPADEKFIRLDGKVLDVVAVGAPCTYDGDVAIQSMFFDVTEQKRVERERVDLEAKIQQAQKLESLGVLAGGIAHDFNNLLVGVLGNADLALHDMAPESPARERVEGIVISAECATDLVGQMLAYAGKGPLKIERLDINALVEEMVHLLKVSISKRAVMNIELAHPMPAITADAAQVRQVVMNLITNASDAVGEQSGTISIHTGVMDCDADYLRETYLDDELAEGQYVFLHVGDTGVGMDRETQKRVFDPFFSTKFAGRGLGLAAVLGIVRGHKGAIKIYSEPGKGTTFRVLFPVSAQAGELRSVSVRKPALADFDQTILLVDDEEMVRAVAGSMLESLGCNVVLAGDGAEALALYTERPTQFDLVLLDLTMPHMDGETCYRRLQRIREDVRVLLTSGYNEHDLMARFAGKGLAGFLQKPYRIEILAEKLKAALGNKKESS